MLVRGQCLGDGSPVDDLDLYAVRFADLILELVSGPLCEWGAKERIDHVHRRTRRHDLVDVAPDLSRDVVLLKGANKGQPSARRGGARKSSVRTERVAE